jgi:hypothetical protein
MFTDAIISENDVGIKKFNCSSKRKENVITEKQIKALRCLIAISKDGDDGNDLAKRILFFLIGASSDFTESVSLTLTNNKEGYSWKEINHAAHAFGGMVSTNLSTRLSVLTVLMGTNLQFSVHYGHYKDGEFRTENQFNEYGDTGRYTFWLAEGHFGHSKPLTPSEPGKVLITSRRELEAIEFHGSGLCDYLH